MWKISTGSVFLIFWIPIILNGQIPEKQAIVSSGQYYYGSGVSFNEREARDHALEELTEQIAVNVASSFERRLQETGDQLTENVKSVLRTHSLATLKNVKTIKTPMPDGQVRVFCFLRKQEVVNIFKERKTLIYNMYEKAGEYESDAHYAQALKTYYFAMLLLNSLPEQNVSYRGLNFTTAIPQKINRIIANTRFYLMEDRPISAREREITVKIEVGSKPAALMDFTFWDGSNQVLVQGRDGMATFQLLGASVAFAQIKVNIKYAYYEARNEYNIIAELWNLVKHPVFNSTKLLRLSPARTTAPQPSKPGNWNIKIDYNRNLPVAGKLIESTVRFLDLINSGDRAKLNGKYKGDPFLRDKILNYLTFNHPRPVSKTLKTKINKTRSGYELRSIPMLHRYPSIHKQTTEYLVLDFSQKGDLVDLNTGIGANLYQKFAYQSKFGGDWERRQQIIKFIEKYRTAYLTRDIETVDLMFAEDALILVGRKIVRKKLPADMIQYRKLGKEPDYEYIKLTKKKYLVRQKSVFQSQQDIFLNFASFDIVKKNNSKDVYGVELRQNYVSTTYADEGYLFLLIDFSQGDPLIYVRAWQPNEWNDSTLVRTANFRIYK